MKRDKLIVVSFFSLGVFLIVAGIVYLQVTVDPSSGDFLAGLAAFCGLNSVSSQTALAGRYNIELNTYPLPLFTQRDTFLRFILRDANVSLLRSTNTSLTIAKGPVVIQSYPSTNAQYGSYQYRYAFPESGSYRAILWVNGLDRPASAQFNLYVFDELPFNMVGIGIFLIFGGIVSTYLLGFNRFLQH
jgi:hypothetical protein